MRAPADADRIRRLARELGRSVPPGTRMYLTGGATAVLEGWRESTVDVDVRFELDLEDVQSMVRTGQVELFRFPAVEPPRLRAAVESLTGER